MRSLIGPDNKRTQPKRGDIISIDCSTRLMTIERRYATIRFKKKNGTTGTDLLLDWLPTGKIALEGCIGMLEYFIGKKLKSLHKTRVEIVQRWEIVEIE
jgi:hypothetical protein